MNNFGNIVCLFVMSVLYCFNVIIVNNMSKHSLDLKRFKHSK